MSFFVYCTPKNEFQEEKHAQVEPSLREETERRNTHPHKGYVFLNWSGKLKTKEKPKKQISNPEEIIITPQKQTIEVGSTYIPPVVVVKDDPNGLLKEDIMSSDHNLVNTNSEGVYKITYLVSDQNGNSITAIHTVNVIADPNGDDDLDGVVNINDNCPNTESGTVVDDSCCADLAPPVITLEQTELTIETGDSFTAPIATASDLVDGDLSNNVAIRGATFDTSVVGSYDVVYTVSENAQNNATATLVVTVQDTTPPNISLSSIEQVLQIGETYTPPTVTATDIVDGDISTEVTIGGDTVDTASEGTYRVVYTSIDNAQNAATATHTVNVLADVSGTATYTTSFESSTIETRFGTTEIPLLKTYQYILFYPNFSINAGQVLLALQLINGIVEFAKAETVNYINLSINENGVVTEISHDQTVANPLYRFTSSSSAAASVTISLDPANNNIKPDITNLQGNLKNTHSIVLRDAFGIVFQTYYPSITFTIPSEKVSSVIGSSGASLSIDGGAETAISG